MGGRGSKSGFTSQVRAVLKQVQAQQPTVAQQVPNDANTPVQVDVLDRLSKMSDAELAQAYIDSQNSMLPNHLGDKADVTQQFVFYMGLNERPTVLDDAAFNQYMQDNNLSQSDILSRSVNGGTLTTSAGNSRTLTPQDVADMMMHSRLNYVGGKHGGQRIGAGTYFDKTNGKNTGYGGHTVNAVLNNKAKIISASSLARKASAFDKSHPLFAKATGGFNTQFYNNNQSIYALCLGYNVVKEDYGQYHNAIDRSVLVYKK